METLADILKSDIATGEAQKVEFKRDFPRSAKDLGDAIASFASSNPGEIYLGVDNSGQVVGVSGIRNLGDLKGKDEYQRRVQGVTSQIVDPPIRVQVDFIEYEGKIVVRIFVPQGSDPVYFSGGIPYIRDLSGKRPLKAVETKEEYRKFFASRSFAKATTEEIFWLETLFQLSDLQLVAYDHSDHMLGDDFNQMQYDLGATARVLQELSTSPYAVSMGAGAQLKRISDILESLEAHRLTGDPQTWQEFGSRLDLAASLATPIIEMVKKRLYQEQTTISDFEIILVSNLALLGSEWEKRETYVERGETERIRASFRRSSFILYRFAQTPQADNLGLTELLKQIGTGLRNLTSESKYFVTWNRGAGFDQIASPMQELLELSSKVQTRLSPL
jgi:hypothetical protein